MKHMKKLAAMLVSVLMGFAMMTTVFAADGNSLTITNSGKTNHTFELYQVFTGDLYDGKLSNVQWGNGVTADGKKALGTADAKAEALKNEDDAKVFANQLVSSHYLTNAVTTEQIAAGANAEFKDLAAGYYLVKDTDDSQTDVNSAYTAYILQVVGNEKVTTKLDVPTVVKKVKDTNDSTGVTSDWQDSADADINDDVQYQITGTMPSNIDDYTTYEYVFTDTMSEGLTYTANTEKITIGNTDVTRFFKETVTTENKDNKKTTVVTWTCGNLKEIKSVKLDENTKVVVSYTAKLNENAVIGAEGNPNTVYLTYSNNPNQGGEGDTGKTPEDKNIVFTYKTVVNKVDKDGKSLAGAGFTLQKKVNGTYTDVKKFDADDKTYKFEFTGLDDGDYKLIESKTPDGYNTITPIEFTISAEHDTTKDEPTLISLSGNKTTGEATFTADKDAGSLTTDVVNKKGSVLPHTGGIGTTIFYVAGGLMVIVAGVLLAAKKKAEAK